MSPGNERSASITGNSIDECEQGSSTFPVEYNVYALSLSTPGAIAYFYDNLPPELVGIPTGNTGLHELYLAFLDYYKHTRLEVVDPIAFQAWMVEEGENFLRALGGEAVILQYLELFREVPLSNPESITAIIKHKANKRQQMLAMQELQRVISSKEIKTQADRDRISQLTEQIRACERDIGYDPLSVVSTGNDIASRADGLWDLPDFLPSPYKQLNKVLGYDEDNGGFVKGGVSVVVAPSGHGKSTFVKCLCNHWLDQGLTILYVNFEEPEAHWERILMTQVTGKNVYAGVDGDLVARTRYTQKFQEKMLEWGDRLMVRHDPETSYYDDLEMWLRDILGHNENLPDVVIIDTIQSMQIKASGGRPRWGEYEMMMIRLEKLAKDMNCLILLTAQENNNRLKDKREVVEQGDIGGSHTIVQKSTVTIVITKKRSLPGQDAEDESIVQLQIPKNRITGTAFIDNPPLLKYNDNTKSFEEYNLPTRQVDYVEWDDPEI